MTRNARPQLMFTRDKPQEKADRVQWECAKVLGEKLIQIESQLNVIGARYANANVVKAVFFYAHDIPGVHAGKCFEDQAFVRTMARVFDMQVPPVESIEQPAPSGLGQIPRTHLDAGKDGALEASALSERIARELPRVLETMFQDRVSNVDFEMDVLYHLEDAFRYPPALRRMMAATGKYQFDGSVCNKPYVELNMLIKGYCPGWDSSLVSPITSSPTALAASLGTAATSGTSIAPSVSSRLVPTVADQAISPADVTKGPPAADRWASQQMAIKECLPLLFQLFEQRKFLPYLTGGTIR
ncbi:Uncharacterized protein PBTT_01729 [Plasmodiophora brassicae]